MLRVLFFGFFLGQIGIENFQGSENRTVGRGVEKGDTFLDACAWDYAPARKNNNRKKGAQNFCWPIGAKTVNLAQIRVYLLR